MKNIENNEFLLGDIIRKSILEMPNPNFEDQLLAKLNANLERRRNLRYVWYSFMCFLAFTILGLLICIQFKTGLKDLSNESYLSIFQVLFVSCFLLYADYFIKFLKGKNFKSIGSRQSICNL